MKNFLWLTAVLLVFASCKKYGCTDPEALNYSDRNTADDGSCVFEETNDANVYESSLNGAAWTYVDPSWETNLSWPTITQDVYDNGALIAYIRVSGNSNWTSLPLTFYQSSTYSTSIEVSWYVGGCTLYWTDSDLTQPITPASIDVKLVVVV